MSVISALYVERRYVTCSRVGQIYLDRQFKCKVKGQVHMQLHLYVCISMYNLAI